MPLRALFLALAAVAVAALVYLGGQKLLASPAAAPPPRADGVEVLVAARALPAGTAIAAADVVWRSWPAGGVDPGYLRRGDPAAAVAGKVSRVAYAPGQPLSRDTLARQGEAGTLALVMAPGMRAVSLAVNAASAVSGLIMPGDHVDIVLTHSLPRAPDATFDHHAAITLVRDRRVLAIEQRLGSKTTDATATMGTAANPIEPRTASIEVEPHEAEMLALGSDLGKLSLVLRPLERDGAADAARATPTRDVDLDPLFAARPARAAAPMVTIAPTAAVTHAGPKVFRGSQADAGDAR